MFKHGNVAERELVMTIGIQNDLLGKWVRFALRAWINVKENPIHSGASVCSVLCVMHFSRP